MPSQDAARRPDEPAESVSTLAANVRLLRAEMRWTTRAFAEQAGLSLSLLYRIEHCRQLTTRLSTLSTLARAFGVDVGVLLSPQAKPRRPWSERDPSATVAACIEHRRKAKGWSQDELATRAGVQRDIVAKAEGASRDVTLDVLDRIASALGMTTAALFLGAP